MHELKNFDVIATLGKSEKKPIPLRFWLLGAALLLSVFLIIL